jgi:hypothetical protein
MHASFLGACALLCATAVLAQGADADWAFSGQLRLQADSRNAAAQGPLAQANALQAGTAPQLAQGVTAEAELHASGVHWGATATASQQARDAQPAHTSSWFNELFATATADSWNLLAGKKIVSWDVGYAFRPNDLVQQETRRTLVSTLPEGRPVLMAERFDADSAWSLVFANPSSSREQTGASEPALAAHYYQRQGALDWYGFARLAQRTGSSVGAALAWVPADALELHASARYLQHADSLALAAGTAPLVTANPWQSSLSGEATQALVGGSWTHASQLSVLLELWWDGTALSPADWSAWRQRNQSLGQLASRGLPAAAVAGNLAWQADALGASSSLQRNNLYARISWDIDAWQPALDLLYHPDDGGLLLTAALLWKGDRTQLQAGVRVTTGPADAVLQQLPLQRQAYVQTRWLF